MPRPDDDHLEDCVDLEDDIDEELAALSCGLMPDGSCALRGTEWCDWQCSLSDEAAHNKRWKRPARPDKSSRFERKD